MKKTIKEKLEMCHYSENEWQIGVFYNLIKEDKMTKIKQYENMGRRFVAYEKDGKYYQECIFSIHPDSDALGYGLREGDVIEITEEDFNNIE